MHFYINIAFSASLTLCIALFDSVSWLLLHLYVECRPNDFLWVPPAFISRVLCIVMLPGHSDNEPL